MFPILSVLMTSYNREQYIGEAIESVIASSFTDWELIIVDDASKDQTVHIAEMYAANDERIRVHVNLQNLGDYKNRNRAASYATGKYIMYVDSDDQILKDGFLQCINAMEAFPGAGIGMHFNDASDNSPFYMDSDDVLKHHFFKKPCLMKGPGGTILRRSFFKQIGGYPEKYGPANDMYFNLKAASLSGVLFLPFTFNYYRIHEGQEINNKYSYLYNNYKYIKDAIIELPLSLTESQKQWLSKKNKRRFLFNTIYYFKNTRNLKKTYQAFLSAEFGFKDAIQGIFHF